MNARNGFSAAEPSESAAYYQTEHLTVCPPRTVFPVNPRTRFGGLISFQRIRFAFGQGCAPSSYIFDKKIAVA
jgi:hypothetical protein